MNVRKVLFLLSLLIAVATHASNRALLIGIGKYDRMATGWTQIHGDKDVDLLKPLLIRQGFTDIVTLQNEGATKNNIVAALKNLAERCRPGDKIYIHFSGHGQPVSDDNHDEKSGKRYDESFIPYDACRDNLKLNGKYEGQHHLIDDELAPLLDNIKVKIGKNGDLCIVADACYSRGIHKDEVTEIDPDIINFARGSEQPFVPKPGSKYLKNLPKPKEFSPGARMVVITACASDESNYEYKVSPGVRYGSLSYYKSLLLKTDADFNRWIENFKKEEYRKRNIFQSFQHPFVEIIP